MKRAPVFYLAFASVFAALIAVFTAFLLHIPVPIGANTAYLHFGDCLIFLAASLLPTPWAMAAAAVGGGIADLLVAPMWAPFTIIIKALLALSFTSKNAKILTKRNLIALLPAYAITIAGYYIAEAVLYGNWITPVHSILGNVIQITGSGLLYILLGLILDRIHFKRFFAN